VAGGLPFGIGERRSRFATKVLGHIRCAPLVRALLGLGAVLSVCGSVGLHPEPVGCGRLRPRASVERLASPEPARVAHVCLICLLHARVSLSMACVVARAVEPAATRLGLVRTAAMRVIDSPSFDGRAPPGSR
jgi:hypothetical protein